MNGGTKKVKTKHSPIQILQEHIYKGWEWRFFLEQEK